MSPSYELRNGQMIRVPDIRITRDQVLLEDVIRTVIVESGARLTTLGRVSGTVAVQNGSLVVQDDVGGTVTVAGGCIAVFHQRMGRTLKVSRGGEAHLLPTAVALGTMRIDGTLINEGVRGVQVSGCGSVEDRAGGRVCQPDEVTLERAVILPFLSESD